MDDRPRAVVLLSGGVDSTTAAALTAREGFALHALTFAYGQRHAAELGAARRVAAARGVVRHEILTIDLRAFGGSALTADIEVPRDRAPEAMAHGIPVTYVPARNTMFLAFALAWAEVLAARAGVEGAGVRVRTPLIRMTKAEIVRAGVAAGVDFALTLSCYDPSPDGAACRRCDACTLRRKGFAEAGVPDPTRYR